MNKDTWLNLTRSQQLGNIGSEIARARYWDAYNDNDNRHIAIERALRLIDLTLDDNRWGAGLKEIARMREVISAWFCEQIFFDIQPKEIENYCINFVLEQSGPVLPN